VTSDWVPEQSASHAGLLDKSVASPSRAQFDAIVVPTCHQASGLKYSMDLARRTGIPLIVVCSKAARKDQVVAMAAAANVAVFALDLPSVDPLGISFATSTDEEIHAASPGWTRDLSMKRNLGLVLARMLGWTKLMFLDDDIFGVRESDVEALAAALDNHSVSALIPEEFPDNSIACHAHRLGGGVQDVFASASGMGVRCDRDDLAFFPNIYNEDWFFFSKEAASRRIAQVGVSRQLEYDPYDDPLRAAQEEFGDLLAEGLYARLDRNEDISGVDAAYWDAFIDRRVAFHSKVEKALNGHPNQELATGAANSIRAARSQLDQIKPSLCQKFVELWQSDLIEWRRYLMSLPHVDSIVTAFEMLDLDYSYFDPSTRYRRP
jgi:hypothetical protein